MSALAFLFSNSGSHWAKPLGLHPSYSQHLLWQLIDLLQLGALWLSLLSSPPRFIPLTSKSISRIIRQKSNCLSCPWHLGRRISVSRKQISASHPHTHKISEINTSWSFGTNGVKPSPQTSILYLSLILKGDKEHQCLKETNLNSFVSIPVLSIPDARVYYIVDPTALCVSLTDTTLQR